MKWSDLTFGQYLEIESIWDSKDSELLDKTVALQSIIFNIDASKISLTEFNDKLKEMEFLKQPVPIVKIKRSYGDYRVVMNVPEITMAQYMDFVNFRESNDKIGILSVFLIPKGKEYMEGYDIDEVKEYISNKLSVVDALAMYAFFLRFFQRYMELSLRFTRNKLKRIKKRENKKRK